VNTIECVRRVALAFVACSFVLSALCVSQAAAQESEPAAGEAKPAKAVPADPEQGKRLFEQNCSQCHGADAGGDEGPDLRGVPARLGNAAIVKIIKRGIPGTAMPLFPDLSEKDAANVVAFLASYNTAATQGTVKGDAKRGGALYQSSGCPACHIIAGQGGIVGPELTRIGAMRGPGSLKATLIDPGANLPENGTGFYASKWTEYLMFRAIEKDGHAVEGIRVSEDSFTIDLKDASGKIHGFWKPDLRSLKSEPGKSFMPSFKDVLSAEQMDDLVAYLMSLKGAQ
jgi:cytochrome c oxidase cbb3-type subunit 3